MTVGSALLVVLTVLAGGLAAYGSGLLVKPHARASETYTIVRGVVSFLLGSALGGAIFGRTGRAKLVAHAAVAGGVVAAWGLVFVWRYPSTDGTSFQEQRFESVVTLAVACLWALGWLAGAAAARRKAAGNRTR